MTYRHNYILFLLAVVLCMFFTGCGQKETQEEHNFEISSISTSKKKLDFEATFTCSHCNESRLESMTAETAGLPIVNVSGSLSSISKTNKVQVEITYYSKEQTFTSQATMKLQGATSTSYPKKNYSLQFVTGEGEKQKLQLQEAWGKHSKYVLKANYVDFSQARNIVSAKLYGQVVKSRDLQDQVSQLVNGGAIDGYPVLLYLNGVYRGLYTLNIPKDNWLFDMKGEGKQALVFGENWSNSVKFKEKMKDDMSNGWDLEYCSTEDSSWVVPSFNRFIQFVRTASDEEFKEKIGQYTSLERSIDTLLFVCAVNGWDNTAKNIIWYTYDGDTWSPSVYDMDDTWGLVWDGKSYYKYNEYAFDLISGNLFFSRLWKLYNPEIVSRYLELRQGVLSDENINKEFKSFFDMIPDYCYEAEDQRWKDVPSRDSNNFNQITEFAKKHLEYLDDIAKSRAH